MDMVMDSDLLFWSGRYDLFVVWSTDRRHPWDSVTSSETSAAVLEIGSQTGSGKAGAPCTTTIFEQVTTGAVMYIAEKSLWLLGQSAYNV